MILMCQYTHWSTGPRASMNISTVGWDGENAALIGKARTLLKLKRNVKICVFVLISEFAFNKPEQLIRKNLILLLFVTGYSLHLLMLPSHNQHCCTIPRGCCTTNRVKRNPSTISINDQSMKRINAIRLYLLRHLSTCNLHYRILHLLHHIQQQFHKQPWHMLHRLDHLPRTESDGSKKRWWVKKGDG